MAARGDYITPLVSDSPSLAPLSPPPMTLEERMKIPSTCALSVGDYVKRDGKQGRVVKIDLKVGEVQGGGTGVWVRYAHSAYSYQCLRKSLVLMRPVGEVGGVMKHLMS